MISLLSYAADANYFFEFQLRGDTYAGRFSPGENKREQWLEIGRWPNVPRIVLLWTTWLQRELSTPDPWKALPGYSSVADLRVAPDVANTQFTVSEAQSVTRALEEIRKILLQHVRGSQASEQLVNQEINRLAETSKQMGRKDWFNIAIGALVQVAIAVALPADVTKHVFEVMKEALGGVVHFLPPVIASGQQLLG